jgi:DNA-binding beta-propeller fold protein YncE
MRRRLLIMAAFGVICATLAAQAASGDGGPGPGVMQGWDGIKGGNVRYVTVPAGGWTAVEVIEPKGGRVIRFMTLKDSWGIPVVAFDGTTEGLMRDGRTLVLAQVRMGRSLRRYSSFVFVDTKKMRIIRTVRVRGDHSFDALSPDGRYLYLVEYVSEQDFNRYRVRAYDLQTDRLLPKPVTDKRESETTMQGAPVSRATPPDGGWVYTLYGGTHESFIHALDTRNVAAICIDLPWRKQPNRLFEFRLRLDRGGNLVVRGPRGRTLVVVDREDHRILSSVRNP